MKPNRGWLTWNLFKLNKRIVEFISMVQRREHEKRYKEKKEKMLKASVKEETSIFLK